MEAVKALDLKKTKIYQASTSELYGKTTNRRQNEKTVFYPRSPYGVSKMFAYWISINYREAYKMFVCNGILFNHNHQDVEKHLLQEKLQLGYQKIF